MDFYKPSVLVVDNDLKFMLELAGMLQQYSCEVTTVQEMLEAYLMLSKGDANFDLVMIDLSSVGFQLMLEAVQMGFTVLMMTAKVDATMVKNALQGGAILCMNKPISPQDFKYLWQYVLREKKRKTLTNGNGEGATLKHKATSREGNIEYISFDSNADPTDCKVKPKSRFHWTPSLHKKFEDAMRQLGEGRCFPKEILKVMNVPGLKRLQVASHLQKCRRQACEVLTSSNPKRHHSKTAKRGLAPQFENHTQPSHDQEISLQDIIPQDNLLPATKNMEGYIPELGQQETHGPNLQAISNNLTRTNPRENVQGNLMSLPQQEIQTGASFDLSLADYGLLGTNDDFDPFADDYFPCTGQVDVSEDTGFWNSI